MGDSQEPARATARFNGELERTPELVWCCALRKNTVNAVVGGFPFTASGDDAKYLNTCPARTLLRIDAELIMHRWTTNEGKPREKLTLAATHIEHESQDASPNIT